MTEVGRAACDGYERTRPVSYGSDRDQVDRVVTAIGGWLSIALSRALLDAASPVSGPTTLTTDTHVGTVDIPAGYTARWDASSGAFCVQGSVGGSGLRHFTDDQFVDAGATVLEPLDGPCR